MSRSMSALYRSASMQAGEAGGVEPQLAGQPLVDSRPPARAALSVTSWRISQNLPCSPAQRTASAAGRALGWKSSGKSRLTKRTLPVSMYSRLSRSKAPTWKARQYGHSRSVNSTSVTGASARPSTWTFGDVHADLLVGRALARPAAPARGSSMRAPELADLLDERVGLLARDACPGRVSVGGGDGQQERRAASAAARTTAVGSCRHGPVIRPDRRGETPSPRGPRRWPPPGPRARVARDRATGGLPCGECSSRSRASRVRARRPRCAASHAGCARRAIPVEQTREPDGTPLGVAVRRLFERGPQPLAEMFLFLAARHQHVVERIRPWLRAGRVVLCDRYTDATVAYQGYGRGLDPEMIRELNVRATGGVLPDLTLLFDLDPAVGFRRIGRPPARPLRAPGAGLSSSRAPRVSRDPAGRAQARADRRRRPAARGRGRRGPGASSESTCVALEAIRDQPRAVELLRRALERRPRRARLRVRGAGGLRAHDDRAGLRAGAAVRDGAGVRALSRVPAGRRAASIPTCT